MASGRTPLQLYRDCLRLIEHVAAGGAKARVLKETVRSRFKANMLEKDPQKIAAMTEE